MNQGNRVWICGHKDDLNQDLAFKIFDSISVKAVVCVARRRLCKLQDIFLNMLRISEFRIDKWLLHSITAERKSESLKKIVSDMKKG